MAHARNALNIRESKIRIELCAKLISVGLDRGFSKQECANFVDTTIESLMMAKNVFKFQTAQKTNTLK